MERTAVERLLEGPKVVNVGLEAFEKDLLSCGAEVVHVHWVPPAGSDAELARLLSKLGA